MWKCLQIVCKQFADRIKYKYPRVSSIDFIFIIMAQNFEVPFDEACCVSQLLEVHLVLDKEELYKVFGNVIYKKVHKIIYRQMLMGTWCNGCNNDDDTPMTVCIHECQRTYATAFACRKNDILMQINNKKKYMSQFAQRAALTNVTRRALSEMMSCSINQRRIL